MAIYFVAMRIRSHFELDELVDFDQELKGQYIDHISRMAVLSMFSNRTVVIHGFSGDIKEAVRIVFEQGNFSFKRVRGEKRYH